MVTDTPIKIQIVKSLSNLKPSRMIAVKADNESSFSLYVTDINGVPYPLKDLQGSGGIITLVNTDGNLVITGADNKVINLAPALLSVINSALQSGDNISELLNDVGYITSSSLPVNTSDLINDGEDGTSVYVEQDDLDLLLQKKQNLPTGFITGLQLSINADPTKIDIAPGAYAISDFTDLENITVQIIQITNPITGITPAYLNTGNISYIALDANQNVIQSSSPFTNEQRRTLAILGAAIHSNLINVNVVNEIKAPIVAPTNQLHDLMKAIGSFNLEGNIYSANGVNLQLDKSAGTVFGLGINANNYLNPHQLDIASQTGLTFRYRLQNGFEYTNRTTIDPANYDNTGVLTPLLNNNKWQVQRINLFQSGLTRIQPGQHEYDSLEEAEANIKVETFTTETNIAENAIFRSYLIVKKNATNLSDISQAKFIPVDKFGNVITGNTALTYANIVSALGFTPEDVANKVTDFSVINDTLYPSVEAVKEQLDSKLDKVTTSGVERVYTINADGSQGTKSMSEIAPPNFYDLYKRHMFYYATGASSGGPLQISISLNESPTGTNVSTNNIIARNISSASTAGSSGDIREGSFHRILADKKFYFDTYVRNINAETVSTERYFYGLTSGLSAFGNIDISAIISTASLLGMGCDTADTNIFIFHRIEGGATVKVDTGFDKTLNHDYRLTMYKLPASNQVYVTLKNITTGVTFTTDFAFANSGHLNPRYHKNNGATASAVTFGLNGFKLFIED